MSERQVLAPETLVLGDRFRVVSLLGGGGMGDVYLAEQVSLGRKVALKVLRKDMSQQPGMSERFRREARLLSSVDHPAVVRVIDFGESHHHTCLVMEFAEGETLGSVLAEGALSPARARRVLTQLVEGLAAIHARGIIHRDLKPDNVVLGQGPLGEQTRLLDFGIARLVEPDEQSRHLSQAGLVLGTPEYISPEQGMGAPLDARSDLYSLGVLAYRILGGALPFPGPGPREYLAQHVGSPPTPLLARAPALAHHRALVDLVMRCLEKDPRRRPQTAQEILQTLHALESFPDPEPPLDGQAPLYTEPLALPPGAEPPVDLLSEGATLESTTRRATAPPAPADGAPAHAAPERAAPSEPWPTPRPAAGPGAARADEGGGRPSAGRSVFPWLAAARAALFGRSDGARDPRPWGGEAPVALGLPPRARSSRLAAVLDALGRPEESVGRAAPRARGLRWAALAGVGLVVVGAGGLWLWLTPPPLSEARRALEAGNAREALDRVERAAAEHPLSPDLVLTQAAALHALRDHAAEHSVLENRTAARGAEQDPRVLANLADDYGRKELPRTRAVLDALPQPSVVRAFTHLSEEPQTDRGWGALRYLDVSGYGQARSLWTRYVPWLSGLDCDRRRAAARRLQALGARAAAGALAELAHDDKHRQCGQEEAARALRALGVADSER